ncbi:hypothetical protein DER53_08820 [Parageobacillus toebii NBRC 107807]|jgi:hypothetical protein|uniref:Uncharacterized protein n=3 Tax=Anoxybacillaceae TaxID=3120669 RepID=A0A6G9J2D4_9BACL|nr:MULTISPECIES: hypothetical protein [Bacillaceae]QNU33786.1 hypothetical protein IC802_12905 [Geobacillus sp. 44C]KYD31684.1 hypothetical protein B4110_0998 [Parageobacillus toebii]MBB3868154.1 hypothetical protein [Parageobacillus toebii NBRC 107807]MED4970548.1 hypothetical protein [Parageobacillus toebii]MED4988698.1 hypothetical protein [Parageobacillus toebii]
MKMREEKRERQHNEAREEMAFEFGDFNAHQPLQLMEERKQQKKAKKKK